MIVPPFPVAPDPREPSSGFVQFLWLFDKVQSYFMQVEWKRCLMSFLLPFVGFGGGSGDSMPEKSASLAHEVKNAGETGRWRPDHLWGIRRHTQYKPLVVVVSREERIPRCRKYLVMWRHFYSRETIFLTMCPLPLHGRQQTWVRNGTYVFENQILEESDCLT
jgi:hypothetical protein